MVGASQPRTGMCDGSCTHPVTKPQSTTAGASQSEGGMFDGFCWWIMLDIFPQKVQYIITGHISPKSSIYNTVTACLVTSQVALS